jgi:hypothetical protein
LKKARKAMQKIANGAINISGGLNSPRQTSKRIIKKCATIKGWGGCVERDSSQVVVH